MTSPLPGVFMVFNFTKGLSKNYVAKNEGVKSTRFSSLADTIFPVNRLSGSSVGGNDFLVFGRRKKLFVLR